MEMTIEKMESIKEKDFRTFANASEKLVKDSWALAKVVYNIFNRDDFKDLYGTLSVLSKHLNISVAQCSKMVKAYAIRRNWEVEGRYIPPISKVQELIPLRENAVTFLSEEEIFSMTTEEIREAVKGERIKDSEKTVEDNKKRKGTYVYKTLLTGSWHDDLDDLEAAYIEALNANCKYLKIEFENLES